MRRMPPTDVDMDTMAVGDYVFFQRQINERIVGAYADLLPAHSARRTDNLHSEEAAWRHRAVHLSLLTCQFSSAIDIFLPERYGQVASLESEYVQPVFIGDTVIFSARVMQIDQERLQLRLRCLIFRGHEVCVRSSALVDVQ